ncbi:AAA family ATPase [Chloroflexota bacterium]
MEKEIFESEYVHGIKEEMEMQRQKTEATILKFLGKGPHAVEAYDTPEYYGSMLAWTVKCVTASPGFQIISVLGLNYTKPFFSDIQTDYEAHESCLKSGLMQVERDGIRLTVTLDGPGYIQIAAGEGHREKVEKFVEDIKDYMNKHNFYRGKKISFGGGISFLNAGQRDWDSIVLDTDMKNSIRMNTIGFLTNVARIKELGIPAKRGIILDGDPGTGKTIICRALMSEAANITCIITDAYSVLYGNYISDLYSLAQDLSPSIVFIEDIDFLGHERHDYYHGTPPLLALLAEMDGITEKTAIVTVATSNIFKTLDKALSERPSRFDCVYRINRPDGQQRVELVNHISKKISLPKDIKEYVAKRTDGFTPAQVQEILYSMAISHIVMEEETMQFCYSDVDSAIARMDHIENGRTMGFKSTCLK